MSAKALRIIAQQTTGTNVSTLTVLKAFFDVASSYSSALFALTNLDATNPVTFIVETSEDGSHADGDTSWSFTVAPGTQQSLEVGGVLRRYWRISAQTTNPYPVAQVTWTITGIDRF